MNVPSIPRAAVIFSLKSFLAGMLALYIALRAGLENPAWSVVTAYIVAQPHAGATVSKGVYRMCGTFVGACASVFMVPPLVQTPLLLGLAIAAWLGACVFLHMLDRTARGYLFALAGYTSCIIIFPVLSHPQDVFDYATARFLEISLGIACSTVVHSVVFPVSTARMLRARLAAALQDAQAVCVDALATDGASRVAPDRQKLAAAINELHELLIHVRHEGPYTRGQLGAIRMTLAQIERIMPMSMAVADRVGELARLGPLPGDLQQFLGEAREWFGATDEPHRQIDAMGQLRQRCDGLRSALGAVRTWQDALTDNLLDRVSELIGLKGAILWLRGPSEGVVQRPDPAGAVAAGLPGAGPRRRQMERDVQGAAGASVAVMLTAFAGNALWIASGWPAGYSAAMMAGVYFSVYSGTPNPSQMLKNKFIGVILRLLLGAVYVVAILPAISDFGALVLAMAPALLLSGVMMGIPRFSAMGFNFVVGVFSPSIVDRTFHTDFQLYLNAGIATLIGIYYAMFMMSVTRFLWVDGMARRTLAAGRRDIASLRYLSDEAQPRWRSRMTHRIGLLTMRMAASSGGGTPADALRDMLIGGALARLHAAGRKSSFERRAAIQSLIREIARHYAALESSPQLPPPPELRARIDEGLAAAALADDRAATLALTSLRRNLFPDDHSVPAGMPAATPAG